MKTQKETSQIPTVVVLSVPLAEWESMQQKIDLLLEGAGNSSAPALGNWLNEEQTQQLLGRRSTSLWKLRGNGTVLSKKIGGRNYYSRQSIIDFLETSKK